MHFGLDLRPSLVRPTGVGIYALALAHRLPRLAPQHRFTFFSSSLRDRYPEWDVFAAMRARLDPAGTFANDYLDRVLGPVLP